MKIEVARRLALAVPLLALITLFQNCGLYVEKDPEASTFQAAEDCINGEADACVFDKNAVAQAGKAIGLDRVGGYQTMAVSLSGRDGSGYLKNADFDVTTTSTARVTAAAGFRRYFNPSDSGFEQVNAYVAAQRAREWMQDAGLFPGSSAGVKIVADGTFNGFVPAANEIHLQRAGRELPAALDQSVIVQLYAQAVTYKASAGASHASLASKATTCADIRGRNLPNGCCTSLSGCGPAVLSGIGDYMVAAVFGEGRTPVGEGWKNDPAGMTICGLPRDPARNSTLLASTVSSACSAVGGRNAVALGALYAAAWWKVRVQSGFSKAAVDRLFLRHLSAISGGDDFATLPAKISAAATTTEESQVASAVAAELSARAN